MTSRSNVTLVMTEAQYRDLRRNLQRVMTLTSRKDHQIYNYTAKMAVVLNKSYKRQETKITSK